MEATATASWRTQATQEWLVVLLPDGKVETVEGGAPSTWLGRSIVNATEAESAIRQAADELLHPPTGPAYLRRRKVSTVFAGRSVEVELLVIDAVPLRRAHTPTDELLMRTLDAFIAQATAMDIELRVEKSDDVPPTFVLDGEKIAWALATLLGNALRFAGQRRPGLGRVRVLFRWDAATRELVIVVRDNGPGMPPSRARWLLEQDPATGKPAGVALVMVRDVVTAHRGTLAVESAVGQGTTFTIRLPR
jgi:hypothetical protein